MGGTHEQIEYLKVNSTLPENDNNKYKAAVDLAVRLSYNAASAS